MRVVTLLTNGKHLYDRIISLSWEVWVHYTSLTPPLVIEVAVLIQESDRSCMSSFKILPFSTILLLQY